MNQQYPLHITTSSIIYSSSHVNHLGNSFTHHQTQIATHLHRPLNSFITVILTTSIHVITIKVTFINQMLQPLQHFLLFFFKLLATVHAEIHSSHNLHQLFINILKLYFTNSLSPPLKNPSTSDFHLASNHHTYQPQATEIYSSSPLPNIVPQRPLKDSLAFVTP